MSSVKVGKCYTCDSRDHVPLYQICRGEDPRLARNLCCWICYNRTIMGRSCASVEDKCTTKRTCPKCECQYSPCRGVYIWNDNHRLVREDRHESEEMVILVCAVCARHPGVIKNWWCKSNYISDHSRARCITCKEINLTREKRWGRCSHCSI